MNPLPEKDDFEFWAYRLRQNERRLYRSLFDVLNKHGQVFMYAFTRYNMRGVVVSREDYDYAATCVTPQVLSRLGPSIGDVEPGFCLLVPELFYVGDLNEDEEETYQRRWGWHSSESMARYTSTTP